MMKNIIPYILFGVCAIILSIIILLKVVTLLLNALWIIAVVGFVCLGFYLLLKAAKKSDEQKSRL